MGKGMKAGKRPNAPGAGNMQKQMQQMQQQRGTVSPSTATVLPAEPVEAFEVPRLTKKIEAKDAVIIELTQTIGRLAALA